MKLRKVKYKNHPILGNLELDFMDGNNHPYQNVIFVGENGTGKTTILDTIAEFLDGGSVIPFEYIEYEADGHVYRAVPPLQPQIQEGYFDILDGGARISMYVSRNARNPHLDTDPRNPRFYGYAISRAKSEYVTSKIQSSTSEALDSNNVENDASSNYTKIKQLIVDIQEQDNEAYASYSDECASRSIAIDRTNFLSTNSKMKRFKDSFNLFFENLKFDGSKTEDNQKKILFHKGDKSFEIDSLSTGEKQIVFRGAQLLRNNTKINGTVVFIDEPELSMHPLWQKKILQYYKGLFTDVRNNLQRCQMFFATHSESVLKSALEDIDNNLVVILTIDGNDVKVRKMDTPFCLNTITSAETNYLAFNVISTDYHIELFSYIQNNFVGTNSRITDVDNYIAGRHEYAVAQHERPSDYGQQHYRSLCALIRNHIDHPDNQYTFTEEELKKSIKLMIEIIRHERGI